MRNLKDLKKNNGFSDLHNHILLHFTKTPFHFAHKPLHYQPEGLNQQSIT